MEAVTVVIYSKCEAHNVAVTSPAAEQSADGMLNKSEVPGAFMWQHGARSFLHSFFSL